MTTQISVRGQQSRAPKGSKGGVFKNTCLVRRLRAGMPKIKVWEVTHHLGLGVDVAFAMLHGTLCRRCARGHLAFERVLMGGFDVAIRVSTLSCR